MKLQTHFFPFAALCLCVMCIQLDSFAVNTALVRMSRDFGVDQDTMKWVVAAYLIGVGTSMYLAGVVSDSVGHDRTCLCGMVLFLVATILCTFAGSATYLIGFRVFQGVAAGIVVSSGIALLTTCYEDFRGKIASLMAMGSLAMAMGPVLGGIVSAYVSWRLIFAVCIPLVGLAILLLYLSPKQPKNQAVRHDYRALISLVAFSLLMVSLSLLIDTRLGSKSFMFFSGLSAFFFILVLYRQFFSPYPVLEVGLLRQKKYLVVTALGVVSNISLLAIIYLFPLSLQAYWRLSLVQSSLSFCAVAMVIGLGGYCSGRIPLSREILFLVCSFCAAGVLFYVASLDISLIAYFISMGGLGFLLGMANSLTLIASQNAAPAGLEGAASGFTKTLVTLLGAMGVLFAGASVASSTGVWDVYEHIYLNISLLLCASLVFPLLWCISTTQKVGLRGSGR